MTNYYNMTAQQAKETRDQIVLSIFRDYFNNTGESVDWGKLNYTQQRELQDLTYLMSPANYDNQCFSAEQALEDASIFFDEFSEYDVDGNVCELSPADIADMNVTEILENRVAA